MSIRVRYFASLKERLGREGDDVLPVSAGMTVGDIWQQFNPNEALPNNVLAAINMEYVSWDSPVHDGDEVAFFPPVTGGLS